jgi:hypothetical protein
VSERIENVLFGAMAASRYGKAPINEQQESRMARIIVMTDQTTDTESKVLMDEHLLPVHLETEPGASQFVERVAWAINDAEAAERR